MQYRRRTNSLRSRLFSFAPHLVLAGASTSVSVTASAQQAPAFPFPSTNIANGVTTSVLTSFELRADYDLWKQRNVERCPQGDARVRYPESGDDTRSEAVGYGMVISAYMGDKATFDGLWDYYQRASPAGGLMNWRRTGCDAGGGGGDTGSAADADVDAAFALVVANKQWPNQGYNTDATTLVGRLRGQLFLQANCAGVLLAGSQFRDCGCVNPSYVPPGYYGAFAAAEAGQAQFWNNAVTASYTYFGAIQNNNNTDLVPAWSTSGGGLGLAGGCTPQVSGGGQPSEFQADAARTPWRVAADFQWNGRAAASQFLQGIVGFAASQHIVQIVSRYNLNGQPLNGTGTGQSLDATGTRSSFTMGGLATAMTASTQDNLDRFTGAWQSMYRDGDDQGDGGAFLPRAFNNSLALLYGLTVTGNMWNPLGANPTRQPEITPVAQGTNQLENGDFDEGFLGWSFANLDDPATPGLRAEGFAMHKAGELQIIVPRAASRVQDTFEVRLSQPVTLQAQQKYLISVKARAAQVRGFKINIEAPSGVIASLGNRRADAPVTIGPEPLTYDWVFASPIAGNASFNVDVGDSAETVIIDDVVFAPTDLPVSVTGELAGQPPPTDGTPVPGGPTTPGTPTTTPGGSTSNPTTPGSVGGDIGQVIPGTGDNSSGTVTGGPQVGSDGASVSGGLPPTPTGRPSGTGTCTTDTDCGGEFKCSKELALCWEPTYGYVWNPNANAWTQPPKNVLGCGPDYVFWPRQNGCYDPVSGYAFNPVTMEWVYVGDFYTAGEDSSGSDDSGCSVGLASNRGMNGWVLAGVLGAAFGLARRRRHA